MTEDEMAGWHHRLHGREFEYALGNSGGQGRLVCGSPLGQKESGCFRVSPQETASLSIRTSFQGTELGEGGRPGAQRTSVPAP